jgi:Fe-S cluster biogenesis protein NfuA
MTEEEKIIQQEALLEKIEKFVDAEIRGYIQQDGGDIQILGFDIETGIVRVQLQGACSTCPSSIMTLTFGVERRLKEQFPEVKSLQAAGVMLNLDHLE